MFCKYFEAIKKKSCAIPSSSHLCFSRKETRILKLAWFLYRVFKVHIKDLKLWQHKYSMQRGFTLFTFLNHILAVLIVSLSSHGVSKRQFTVAFEPLTTWCHMMQVMHCVLDQSCCDWKIWVYVLQDWIFMTMLS